MWRIFFVFSLFCLFQLAILARLFYWQILQAEKLQKNASDQHVFSMILPARRGEIFTQDGYPLVINTPASFVFAEPKNIENVFQFSQQVGAILNMDSASISGLLTGDAVWAPIQHKVSNEDGEKLRALNLRGLGFEKEAKRYYPEASMAAQTLGFVGSDEHGNDYGYFGLEGFYNRELRGKDGRISIEKDSSGAPILVGNSTRIEPENGSSLYLWIDRSIQHIAEKKLLEGLEKYGAKEGTVTIMDPQTGGILAMASFPSYEPAVFSKYPKELYSNPIVAASFEPGSTFKSLVMAKGIDLGVIGALTTMEETGPVQIASYNIRTWNNVYNGTVTMTDVLTHSSNVGMVFVQQKIGTEKFLQFLRDSGLGDTTGVDLEDEARYELRDDAEWKEIDLATASFGQGIAVTPLQMVRAVGAIANGGYLVTPQMVKEIRSSDGKKSIRMAKTKKSQIFSKKTTEIVKEMMVTAVDEGEAKWAKPKGYRIAGKTGTAQIPVSGHYDETKTIASFIGFAPADNPRFVMLVTLREPSSSQWGSETAAPLFFSIAKDVFLYLGIPPQ